MNLEPLQRGVTQFLVIVSATVTTTFTNGLPANPAPSITQKPRSENVLVLPKPAMYNEISSSVVPEATFSAFQNADTVLTQSEVLGHETTQTSQLVTKKPTSTPTPTKVIKPTTAPKQPADYQVPQQAVAANTPSLSSDLIFQMINDHRASLSLPAFEKEAKLCEIAQYRAPQLQEEVANGTIHKGFYDMNLPFWATENMAYYQSEQQNMNFWLGSYIHRSAIEGDYKYSCGSCSGNACVQIFTNYIPK